MMIFFLAFDRVLHLGPLSQEWHLFCHPTPLDQIAEKADLWIHGHMHDSLDCRIGHRRNMCNPFDDVARDGESENDPFDPHFIEES